MNRLALFESVLILVEQSSSTPSKKGATRLPALSEVLPYSMRAIPLLKKEFQRDHPYIDAFT